MDWIIGLLAFIIVLSLIIVIHEGGHFFFAKKAGILCYEFALGMGPVITQKRKNETTYSLRAIPLGGYVSMAGEEIDADLLKDVKEVKLEFEGQIVTRIIVDVQNPKFQDLPTYKLLKYDLIGTKEAKPDELYLNVILLAEDEDPRKQELNEEQFVVSRDAMIYYKKNEELQIAPYDRSFTNKKLGARFMTVFAGPLMNFVLAWVIFIVIGLIGGYANEDATIINDVTKDTPAYIAGLRDGDEIIKIGNYEKNDGTNLTKWNDISAALDYIANGKVTSYDGTVEVTYIRDNKTYTTKVFPNTLIYSIEMVFQTNTTDVTKANLPYVGSYSDEATNKKTKAYLAGLRDGDLITKIEEIETKKQTEILTKYDVLKWFANYERKNIKGEDVRITVLRGEETKTFDIESYSSDLLESQNVAKTKVQLGISPGYKFNFLKLLYMPLVQTKDAALLVFDTLRLLFTDKTVNIDDLSGPIGIFSIIKQSVSQGLLSVLNWAAIISVNVGLMNLLPLPALDGGRLAFLIYEAITKKRPNPKVENIIHGIGFALLMALFIFVAFNDVIRLFFR